MGTQLPPQKNKGAQPPIFGPCLLWSNGWMDQDITWCEGRPQISIVLHGDPAPPAHKKRHIPPIFGPCLLWPNGHPSQLLLSTCILSIASSLHNYQVWQSIFFYDLSQSFLWPASRSYTFHFKICAFFTQSFSSFLKACPYHLNLCHCITVIISSIPSLSLNSRTCLLL